MMDFHALKKDLLSMEDYLQEAKKILDNLTGINRQMLSANLHHQILLGLGLEYELLVSTIFTMRIAASLKNYMAFFGNMISS